MNDCYLDPKEYQTVGKGRRALSALLDYFFVVVLTFFLFGTVAIPSLFSLPSVRNVESESAEKQSEVLHVVESTRLQRYDETTGTLHSLSEDAEEAIVGLLKTSCYHDKVTYDTVLDGKVNAEDVSREETFYPSTGGDYSKDRLSYYFLSFRKEREGDYAPALEDFYDREKFNTELLDLDGKNADLVPEGFDLSKDIFVLSEEKRKLLLSYRNYGTGSGKTIQDRLTVLYRTLAQKGIEEVEKRYVPYQKALADLDEVFHRYVVALDTASVLSYLVSFLVAYLLFPLLFRKGRTLSEKVFRLLRLRSDQTEPRLFNQLLKALGLFVESFSATFFCPLFLGRIRILSMGYLGPVSLFQLCLFSLLVSLLSLLYLAFSKGHQTLSDLVSSTYLVDLAKPEGGRVYGHGKDGV